MTYIGQCALSTPPASEVRRLVARREELAEAIRRAGRDHRASEAAAAEARDIVRQMLGWRG